jgi:hypothetical protein
MRTGVSEHKVCSVDGANAASLCHVRFSTFKTSTTQVIKCAYVYGVYVCRYRFVVFKVSTPSYLPALTIALNSIQTSFIKVPFFNYLIHHTHNHIP